MWDWAGCCAPYQEWMEHVAAGGEQAAVELELMCQDNRTPKVGYCGWELEFLKLVLEIPPKF